MSVIIDPTSPTDSSSPTLGAADIRAITAALQEMFGGAGSASVTYAVPPFVTDVTTGLTTVPGPPTVDLGIATKKYVQNGLNTNFIGIASGTDTYVVTLAPVPQNLGGLVGVPLTVQFQNANTGPATLNCNGFGAHPITKNSASALVAGNIIANQYCVLVLDNLVNFQIIGKI